MLALCGTCSLAGVVACSSDTGYDFGDQAGGKSTSSLGGASNVGGAGAPATAGGPPVIAAAGTATGGDTAAGAGTGGVAGSGAGGQSGGGGGTPSGGGSQGGSAGTAADPGTMGDGDFEAGPTYPKQSDLTSKGNPVGKSFSFTLSSSSSTIYTGLDTTLNDPRAFTRKIDVYIPAKYEDGTEAPYLVMNDGPEQLPNVKLALDNLTASSDPVRRLPAFVAIAVANGGGDSKGSERGLEYDTMSDRFARFIDTEVVPAVLANQSIKAAYPKLALTKNPDGHGAMGCSSGAAAALTMGWFRPDLFRRIITYSGTFVDQQDDDAAEEKMFPFGAWEYHSSMSLIANSAPKPLRIFLNVNEMDNRYTDAESTHHNWVMANQRTAAVLKAKNYHYRYVFGKAAGHCAAKVRDVTLADTLVWVWRGYP
jgi:enterochelin esterase family protein